MSEEANIAEENNEVINEVIDDRESRREAMRAERESRREAMRAERESMRSNSNQEKQYYFNTHINNLVTTFHLNEEMAKEKFGDDILEQADENNNIIIYDDNFDLNILSDLRNNKNKSK
jgi:hypothetical protein